MHNPDNIKKIYSSYLRDYGKGYNLTTFFQYIAACLTDYSEKPITLKALRDAANNLEDPGGIACTRRLEEKRSMKYGIRMLTVDWTCKDGGDDYTGTEEEMKTLVNAWKREIEIKGYPLNVRYSVIPYNGENGKAPAFPVQYESSRNSRMKE